MEFHVAITIGNERCVLLLRFDENRKLVNEWGTAESFENEMPDKRRFLSQLLLKTKTVAFVSAFCMPLSDWMVNA